MMSTSPPASPEPGAAHQPPDDGEDQTPNPAVAESETAEPEGAEPDLLAHFIRERVEPARHTFRTAEQLPSTAALLGSALNRRRITVKQITAGRWVFEFSSTVIGGFANGVTTLVSAHSRRVLRDRETLNAHLDLMEIPHDASATSGMRLRGFVVGRTLVSLLALVPPYETDDDAADSADRIRPLAQTPQLDQPGTVVVDITDDVPEPLTTLAVDAVRAVPGLMAAGVDLQVRTLDSAAGAVVVSIDEQADLLPHHYPTLGPGRQVADAMAEQILFTAAV